MMATKRFARQNNNKLEEDSNNNSRGMFSNLLGTIGLRPTSPTLFPRTSPSKDGFRRDLDGRPRASPSKDSFRRELGPERKGSIDFRSTSPRPRRSSLKTAETNAMKRASNTDSGFLDRAFESAIAIDLLDEDE